MQGELSMKSKWSARALLALFSLITSVSVSAAETPSPAPESCSALIGACDYYRCREAQQSCGPRGYFLGFGDRYCRDYVTESVSFTPAGQEWLRRVRACLQQELENPTSFGLTCREVR